MGSLTHIYKTEHSNRKLLMSKLSAREKGKMLVILQAMQTTLLACIASTFEEAALRPDPPCFKIEGLSPTTPPSSPLSGQNSKNTLPQFYISANYHYP